MGVSKTDYGRQQGGKNLGMLLSWVKVVCGLDYTHLYWVRVDARSIRQELDPGLCEPTLLCFWCIVFMLQWHVVVVMFFLCSPMQV